MQIFGFLSVLQILLFLTHFFVYKTFVRFFAINQPSSLWWARAVFFILSICFLLVSTIAYRYYGPIIRGLYAAAAIWMGTFYWLIFASLLSWLTYGIGRILLPGKNLSIVGVVLFALALLTSAYGLWHSSQIKVVEVSVKLDNLPTQWRGKRAVLVADTHLGNFRNLKFAHKVSNLISAQNPDIVFIPGDFFDGPPADYAKLAAPFGKINSRFGVFFAAGNHEEFRDTNPLLSALRAAGVKVLDNQMENVDGLQVIGVGYGATVDPKSQIAILSGLKISPNTPSVLIKHSPAHIEAAEQAGISLQVSGHTHRGQVYPLEKITKKIYGKFYYGLNRLNTTQVFTTSGVGTWGPPQRVGTNSEIVIITFE